MSSRIHHKDLLQSWNHPRLRFRWTALWMEEEACTKRCASQSTGKSVRFHSAFSHHLDFHSPGHRHRHYGTVAGTVKFDGPGSR